MVKFIDVDPNDIPNLRQGRRGRVSYPIMKSFLESGKDVVMLDRSDMKRNAAGLVASLSMYAKNKNLPIRVFMRNGELYLLRTDAVEGKPPAHVDIDRKIAESRGREIAEDAELEEEGEEEEITPATVKAK